MKKILLVCFLAAATGAQAAREYREFTSADGKTIRGCIVGVDPAKGTVQIERDNRRTVKVPITVFSETDQAYIQDWEVLRNFMLERSFRISAKRKKGVNKGETFSNSRMKQKVEETSYEITLENRSICEFKNLKMEYCIYYEQETTSRKGGKDCNQGVYCGDLSVDAVALRTQKILNTEPVSTYTRELDSDWIYLSGSDNVHRGDVHGIWIRIHLKLPSGQKGTREFCLPDSLSNSKAWMTSSIKAGMN